MEKDTKIDTYGNPSFILIEIGFLIAVPLIVLALLGRMLDKKLDTSPLFLIIAIFLSITISGILVWRNVKEFEKQSHLR